MDSEVQLVQAADIASNAATVDPAIVSQALQYLEQLKQATHESWSTGWAVWTARDDSGSGPKYGAAVRMFGLNLVDDYLDNRCVADARAAEALGMLHESALAYLECEFVRGNGEQGVAFLRNKFAQTMALLLLQSASLTNNNTLFPALLTLCRTHPADSPAVLADGSPALNAMATDLVLRVLHDLSLSLGSDVTLRSVRGKERLQRDALVRDVVRAHHAPAIATLLWKVIEESLAASGTGTGPRQLNGNTAAALSQLSMAVVGDYVTWIDISLIVNVETLPLLFASLRAELAALRCVTCDTLCEIVGKGMKPADKLALMQALNLGPVITTLESSTRSEAHVEFREHLARLVNALCTELCKVAEDTTGAEEASRDAAQRALVDTLPLELAFLTDEYDEPAEQVLPSLYLVVAMYKKLKRRAGSGLSESQSAFVTQLLTLVLRKLQFNGDFDWEDTSLVGGAASAENDDEEEDDEPLVRFYELRKQLQVLLGAIAGIDEPLVSRTILNLIGQTLSSGEASRLPWEQAELVLHAASCCGEVLTSVRGNKVGLGPHSFVQLPEDPGKSRGVKQSVSVYQALPRNDLGEIMQLVLRSTISMHAHPVVQMQYFEVIVRYASSFVLWPDLLPDALSAFLDARGLRNEHAGMRRRINYLFYRFVREVRSALPGEFIPKLLEGMQDSFCIQAVLPAAQPDEDVLAKATEKAGAFDSQLYLFDTAGLLIAALGSTPDTQVMLLKAITGPLAAQLEQAVEAARASPGNLQPVLQVHHLMLALSTLAKGFPDYDAGRVTEPAWIPEFKPLTEHIVLALTALNRFQIVREAARGAFARIVASTGPAVLPYIPSLVDALVNQVTEGELVDLLSFFGLLTNKYKENVRDVMDDLLSALLNRIFSFLNQGITGTDDILSRADTERAYFGLLNALLNASLDGVLLSDKNRPQLETVLQSLVYYAENAEPASQRAAINVLARLISLWARSGDSAAVPGFEQFVYSAALPLVFQVPSKATFDSSDAQSQLVLTELAALLRTIYQARGDEFLRYLTEVFLPGVQCPGELAAEFVQNVQTLNTKPLKRYLDSFIAKSRGA
ncbi:pre-tRNA nuclear export protein [Malassezia cuniculi]|uniref:Exportin-T n=1 Tax=Malassezia cuniculi TaxID=948313 RepID=A0AAF0EWH6_9BASI|nr:pre-tRNA nuclear export protein [Malassezia cuniculi]